MTYPRSTRVRDLYGLVEDLLDRARLQGDDACVDACTNALAGGRRAKIDLLRMYGVLA